VTFCEHGDELSGCLITELLDQLNNCNCTRIPCTTELSEESVCGVSSSYVSYRAVHIEAAIPGGETIFRIGPRGLLLFRIISEIANLLDI